MISWRKALETAEIERPDLSKSDQRIIAKRIWIEKNLIESYIISITLAVIAMIVSLMALCK